MDVFQLFSEADISALNSVAVEQLERLSSEEGAYSGSIDALQQFPQGMIPEDPRFPEVTNPEDPQQFPQAMIPEDPQKFPQCMIPEDPQQFAQGMIPEDPRFPDVTNPEDPQQFPQAMIPEDPQQFPQAMIPEDPQQFPQCMIPEDPQQFAQGMIPEDPRFPDVTNPEDPQQFPQAMIPEDPRFPEVTNPEDTQEDELLRNIKEENQFIHVEQASNYIFPEVKHREFSDKNIGMNNGAERNIAEQLLSLHLNVICLEPCTVGVQDSGESTVNVPGIPLINKKERSFVNMEVQNQIPTVEREKEMPAFNTYTHTQQGSVCGDNLMPTVEKNADRKIEIKLELGGGQVLVDKMINKVDARPSIEETEGAAAYIMNDLRNTSGIGGGSGINTALYDEEPRGFTGIYDQVNRRKLGKTEGASGFTDSSIASGSSRRKRCNIIVQKPRPGYHRPSRRSTFSRSTAGSAVKDEVYYDSDSEITREARKRKVREILSEESEGPIQLWQFLLDLLTNYTMMPYIKWVGFEGQFILVDPHYVARLWGRRKNKNAMNYEKLSRALRYYYKEKNIISKVHGEKYTYKFDIDLKMIMGFSAEELHKQCLAAQMKYG